MIIWSLHFFITVLRLLYPSLLIVTFVKTKFVFFAHMPREKQWTALDSIWVCQPPLKIPISICVVVVSFLPREHLSLPQKGKIILLACYQGTWFQRSSQSVQPCNVSLLFSIVARIRLNLLLRSMKAAWRLDFNTLTMENDVSKQPFYLCDYL